MLISNYYVCIILLFCVAAKASASYLRVHYKHCREIAHAIKGMPLERAKTYLKNVLQYKEAIPITKYGGGRGRHAQAKAFKTPGDKCFWPQKATKSFLDLLTNIESNCEVWHSLHLHHARELLHYRARAWMLTKSLSPMPTATRPLRWEDALTEPTAESTVRCF